METMLQQLYRGELCPRADAANPNAQSNYQSFAHRRDYFGQILREKAPELEANFNILMEDLTMSYTTDVEEMFYQGFGLAVKLFSEGLSR